MISIATIFGTRPEAIKLAPVIQELAKYPDIIKSRIIVTAQHREMLDQVLSLFKIVPHEDLNIMQHNQTLFQITTRALSGLEPVLAKNRPDIILVQGDTTTVFASALAAFYHKIAVGHVEAGLRTSDKYNPFPEEMNRRLATTLSDLHFAPTEQARRHLLSNGVSPDRIFLTGNTITDALEQIRKIAPDYSHPILKEKDIHGKRILLVEAHRRENLGAPLKSICFSLLKLVNAFKDIAVIFSVHRNPRVMETVYGTLSGHERIYLVEPMDYPTLVDLEMKSYLILTDSGGIQEEAPSFGVPVLVLRKTTERPEGIETGAAKLAGTDEEDIFNEAASLLSDKKKYAAMKQTANPYGDGQAARRTVEAIFYHFKIRPAPPDEFSPKNTISKKI